MCRQTYPEHPHGKAVCSGETEEPFPPQGWTRSSAQLEADPSSPLPDPPSICSPFLLPAAPCTCTPRRNGIYPAPGARCKGSTLINLAGTGAWASCLACARRDGPPHLGRIPLSMPGAVLQTGPYPSGSRAWHSGSMMGLSAPGPQLPSPHQALWVTPGPWEAA